MNFSEIIQNFRDFEQVAKPILIKFGIFLLFILLSFLVGRYTPLLVRLLLRQFFPQQLTTVYEKLIYPIRNLFKLAGTLILISFSLNWIKEYQLVYNFINPFIDLAVIISLAWLVSRLFRQFLLVYGIDLLRKFGREVDELLLVFETLANVIIGFFAVLAFAKNRFDLVGLVTGLGIAGVAVAFAAQKTLEQLLGTIVLYLDRPFVPGEYIRLQRSQQIPEGLFGRVESIGLRSTKIRTAAKSTLFIVPNSILANLEIENITRGKKVMVLLYIDFLKFLEEREQALVQQVIANSTNSLFGIDPGSTNITLTDDSENQTTHARVTFFILGSSENSIQLRKRLLELANEKISKHLHNYGIEFRMQEPTIYVESPVTI
ncbi:small mechanosensitive ion channel [Kalymmatonema gypsitolerans NIES-4073]|nr:small mechanosensitive ion channel [Scytonema sp. NIES-4073]